MPYHLRFVFGKMSTKVLLQVSEVILRVTENPFGVKEFHDLVTCEIEWSALTQYGRFEQLAPSFNCGLRWSKAAGFVFIVPGRQYNR